MAINIFQNFWKKIYIYGWLFFLADGVKVGHNVFGEVKMTHNENFEKKWFELIIYLLNIGNFNNYVKQYKFENTHKHGKILNGKKIDFLFSFPWFTIPDRIKKYFAKKSFK